MDLSSYKTKLALWGRSGGSRDGEVEIATTLLRAAPLSPRGGCQLAL